MAEALQDNRNSRRLLPFGSYPNPRAIFSREFIVVQASRLRISASASWKLTPLPLPSNWQLDCKNSSDSVGSITDDNVSLQ
jgi:hypothetical protein